jgi:opacity protein-like surface antigen
MAGTLVGVPALQSQQTQFSVGAGAGVPLGTYDDVVRVGWQATGAVSFSTGSLPVAFQVDASIAQFSDETPLDIKNQLIYATFDPVYRFSSSLSTRFHPYVLAGVGVYHSKETGQDAFGGSATKFGLNAGAGLNFRVGRAELFFETRIHDVFTDGPNVTFLPLTLGVRFGR